MVSTIYSRYAMVTVVLLIFLWSNLTSSMMKPSKKLGTESKLHNLKLLRTDSSSSPKTTAFNFKDGFSKVDARTGIYQFDLTIGYVTTGTKRQKLKLMYDTRVAQSKEKPLGIQQGWYLSGIPYIIGKDEKAETSIAMGDGSVFIVPTDNVGVPKKEFKHIHTRNTKVEYNEVSWWWKIYKDSDMYQIDQATGIGKYYESREGFPLTYNYDTLTGLLSINNSEKTVFQMTNSGNKVHLVTLSDDGNIDYSITNDGRSIVCNSCPGKLEYKFTYDLYLRITHVVYPTGLTESINYSPINPDNFVTDVVREVFRKNGKNKHAQHPTDVESRDEKIVYDYNPYKNSHDFQGTKYLLNPNYENIMDDGVGEYTFGSKICSGGTCTWNKYNKFNLQVEKEIRKDEGENQKGKLIKRITTTYPCRSDQKYADMIKECKQYRTYHLPRTIKTTFFSKTTDKQFEITKSMEYTDFGERSKITDVMGAITTIEYLSETEDGEKELPVKTVKHPAPVNNRVQNANDHWPKVKLLSYADVKKFGSGHGTYKISSKMITGFMDPEGDILKQFLFNYEYCINLNSKDCSSQYCFGKIQQKHMVALLKNNESLITVYSCKLVKPNVVEETEQKCINSTSGLQCLSKFPKLKQKDVVTRKIHLERYEDGRRMERIFDGMERTIQLNIRPNDESSICIATNYSYTVADSENEITISHPTGVKEKWLMYNNGKKMESQTLVDGNYMTLESFTYDSLQRPILKYHYFKDENNILQKQKTSQTYDELGHVVEELKANGLFTITQIEPVVDGITTLRRTKTADKSKEDTGVCLVNNAKHKIIRYCHLKSTTSDLTCNITDCLALTRHIYDGFNREHVAETVDNTKKIVNKKYNFFNKKGELYKTVQGNNNEMIVHHKYDQMHTSKVSSIAMESNGKRIQVALREFDAFGRKVKEVVGDRTKLFFYDTVTGKIAKMQLPGNKNATYQYNHFAVLDSKSVKSTDDYASWNYKYTVDYHNVKSIHTTFSLGYSYDKGFTYSGPLNLLSSFATTNDIKKDATSNKSEMKIEYDLLGRHTIIEDHTRIRKAFVYDKETAKVNKIIYTGAATNFYLSMEYDEFQHITHIAVHETDNIILFERYFEYDTYHRPISLKFVIPGNNDIILEYTYDDFNWITQKKLKSNGKTMLTENMVHDNIGRISTYTCSETPNVDNAIMVCPPATSSENNAASARIYFKQYNYDHFNNIVRTETTTQMNTNITKVYLYDNLYPIQLNKLQQYITDSAGTGTTSGTILFLYDNNGNMIEMMDETNITLRRMKYNSLNQLYSSTDKGMTYLRYYDEDGLLLFENSTAKNQWTLYHYTNDKHAASEQQNQDEAIYVDYLGEVFGLLHKKDKAKNQLYHTDAHSSTIGSIKEKQMCSYDPFGSSDHSKTSCNGRFQFHNLILSGNDSFLTAKNGRAYFPEIQRFIQEDPLSPFGKSGAQAYAYSRNSPTLGHDRSGEVFEMFAAIFSPVAEALEVYMAESGAMAATSGVVELDAATSEFLNDIDVYSDVMKSLPVRNRAHIAESVLNHPYENPGETVKAAQLSPSKIAKCYGTCGHQAAASAIKQIEPEMRLNTADLVRDVGGRGKRFIDQKYEVAATPEKIRSTILEKVRNPSSGRSLSWESRELSAHKVGQRFDWKEIEKETQTFLKDGKNVRGALFSFANEEGGGHFIYAARESNGIFHMNGMDSTLKQYFRNVEHSIKGWHPQIWDSGEVHYLLQHG